MNFSSRVLSELSQANSSSAEDKFDYLKEDFTVYIQSLLSQDVDSSFLHEIKKFNGRAYYQVLFMYI